MRCAETTFTSWAMSSAASTSAAAFMVSQSEREPMTIATRGSGISVEVGAVALLFELGREDASPVRTIRPFTRMWTLSACSSCSRRM